MFFDMKNFAKKQKAKKNRTKKKTCTVALVYGENRF